MSRFSVEAKTTSCFLSSLIPGASQIIGRIRYDIFLGVSDGWMSILQIVLGYSSDIFIIFVGYLLIYLTVIHIKLRREEGRL